MTRVVLGSASPGRLKVLRQAGIDPLVMASGVDRIDEKKVAALVGERISRADADFVRDALGLVARARGMGEIAKKAGLNRESLYKALGEAGNPEFGTVMRIVHALGLTLSARPTASAPSPKRRRVA